MRNQNKDVLAICKGKYDTEKYSSQFDALKAYYMREYWMEERFVTNEYILKVLLLPALSEYLKRHQWEQLCYDIIVAKMECLDVILKIISILNLTTVRDYSIWIIDLSEYPEGYTVI